MLILYSLMLWLLCTLAEAFVWRKHLCSYSNNFGLFRSSQNLCLPGLEVADIKAAVVCGSFMCFPVGGPEQVQVAMALSLASPVLAPP